MGLDSLAVSVTAATGHLVGANELQCALLQRPKSRVVGHQWSEWSLIDDVPRMQHAFEECLAGTPFLITRCMLGAHGMRTDVLTEVFSCEDNGSSYVIAISQLMHSKTLSSKVSSGDIADYILGMSDELSELAVQSDLILLGKMLDDVAREAERIITGSQRILLADL